MNGDGQLTILDLEGRYSVKQHPQYLSGQKTEGELLRKFLAKMDKPDDVDGVITHAEFLSYYEGVSSGIDHDAHFDLMMRNAYKI